MENQKKSPKQRGLKRIPDYDYSSPGAYFITLCTENRKCLFGDIANDQMIPNIYGNIVLNAWKNIPNENSNILLDYFTLMPNHLHGILHITKNGGFPINKIIQYFKTQTAKEINLIRNTPGKSLWQRNYYERVIRNEEEIEKIREYIINNPLKWALDEENPNNLKIR